MVDPLAGGAGGDGGGESAPSTLPASLCRLSYVPVWLVLPQTQPADGHPIPGLRAAAAPVPGRGHPDRHSISVVPVALGSFGRTWPCSAGSVPVRCRCLTDRSQWTPCLLITERAGHRRGGA